MVWRYLDDVRWREGGKYCGVVIDGVVKRWWKELLRNGRKTNVNVHCDVIKSIRCIARNCVSDGGSEM